MNRLLSALGAALARYLVQPVRAHGASPATSQHLLERALQPGDVLLVEGTSRIAVIINYLTQSTWSHAALYVGPIFDAPGPHGETLLFVEADTVEGVRAVGFREFAGYHCRICRPVRLSAPDLARLIGYARDHIGMKYDLRNVFDLLRYLLPPLPVPRRFRRRLIALGSGDPTRAICSTLLARAFGAIRYPILPELTPEQLEDESCLDYERQRLHIRRCNLIVPRDFDVSPYFEIVKPSLVAGFDYRRLPWIVER